MLDQSIATHPGYVYIIRAGEYYKIGRAIDVRRRVSQLSLPFEIDIVHTITVSDMARAERYVHNLMRDKRLRGEWYALDTTDPISHSSKR
jgi:hypothetical protein